MTPEVLTLNALLLHAVVSEVAADAAAAVATKPVEPIIKVTSAALATAAFRRLKRVIEYSSGFDVKRSG